MSIRVTIAGTILRICHCFSVQSYFRPLDAGLEVACGPESSKPSEHRQLEETMHQILKDAGHGEHLFGPPIHGIGIEFEESPLSAGHAFFHDEKAPPPLAANVVSAISNCGLYLGPLGARVEDTVVAGPPRTARSYELPTQLDLRTS